ncbi:MAG: SDR family NAD(P)-dependent oxidoreductase, partial [Leptospira sp.]|nr:SDR family NAD(P)-dependent oxidoreductase [Leptospira sp.]
MAFVPNNNPKSEDLISFFSQLEKFANHPETIALLSETERVQLFRWTGQISRPDRDSIRKRNRKIRKLHEDQIRNKEKQIRQATGIREARTKDVFTAPDRIAIGSDTQTNQSNPTNESNSSKSHWNIETAPELHSPRNCYVCKTPFKKMHFFYDSMCPKCAEFNYDKRFQTSDLRGQVVLITGSRLKIGYQSALMLLRAGATVIATTRFPVDSALRFAQEKDFEDWSQNLQVFGLDLRHTPSVEIFCNFLNSHLDRLDHIINNAAQTVRRPPGFYAHLMQNESTTLTDFPDAIRKLFQLYEQCHSDIRQRFPNLSFEQNEPQNSELSLPISWQNRKPAMGILSSAQLSQIPFSQDDELEIREAFPMGKLDADLQQVDLRKTNSWRMKLGEVPTSEMLEVQLVNIIAPFVICNRLLPLIKQERTDQKHIVNVSAMEGKFHRFKKEERHPHTNMAKAALNMLTHTSAGELKDHGIFMNSVDTGWVTDEDPIELA